MKIQRFDILFQLPKAISRCSVLAYRVAVPAASTQKGQMGARGLKKPRAGKTNSELDWVDWGGSSYLEDAAGAYSTSLLLLC